MESGIHKISIGCTVVRKTEGVFEECAGILWEPDMRDCGVNEGQNAIIEQFSVSGLGITESNVLQADDEISRYIAGHEKIHVIRRESRGVIPSQGKRAVDLFES